MRKIDIIITTPKSEIENSRKEGEMIDKEGYWFRTFHFRPKVEKGDKIFFVENGLITGYGIIFQIQSTKTPIECEVTNREWGRKGDWMVSYKDWHWLKNKIPFKGFQGIRYVDKLSIRAKLKGGENLCF